MLVCCGSAEGSTCALEFEVHACDNFPENRSSSSVDEARLAVTKYATKRARKRAREREGEEEREREDGG